jgi:hypothetical protein
MLVAYLEEQPDPSLGCDTENQPLWIHGGKVFCCLEAQFDVGPNDNDGLA